MAKSLLVSLFQRDPNRRLGGGKRDAEEIKTHLFFSSIDWQRVYEKLEPPPFRPTLVSKTDVQYFDKVGISKEKQRKHSQDRKMCVMMRFNE